MNDIIEPILIWGSLALLFLLCLPFAWIRKCVLEVCAWGLRLALLALVGGAGYLWFRPEQMPVEVVNAIQNTGFLSSWLPEPGTRHFGVCTAALAVAVCLPLLAVFDVTRKLAVVRVRRVRESVVESQASDSVTTAPAIAVEPAPVLRRVDRRAAAATMATAANSRRVVRVTDDLEK